jgi:hypothetical protein
MSRARLCALVAIAAIALTQITLPTAARATGTCAPATPFVATASGSLDATDDTDFWQTVISGTTTIGVDTDARDVALSVTHTGCTDEFCWAAAYSHVECTVTFVGQISVLVWSMGGAFDYAITASPPVAALPPQCGDGVDNDRDGSTDYPNDPGCSAPDDATEASLPQNCIAGLPACVAVVNGNVVQNVRIDTLAAGATATYHVVGEVDVYAFPLPTGGFVTASCVVLGGSTTADPCGAAGGTYVSRTALLYDDTVDQPSPTVGQAFDIVAVCAATFTVTVAGNGVNDFPAYSLC